MWPAYVDTGWVMWPDIWAPDQTNPMWKMLDQPAHIEVEAGQLLVDRRMHWKSVWNTASHLQTQDVYNVLNGDKDTYQFALRLSNSSFSIAPFLPLWIGYETSDDGFCGHSLVHLSFENTPVFVHRVSLKFGDVDSGVLPEPLFSHTKAFSVHTSIDVDGDVVCRNNHRQPQTQSNNQIATWESDVFHPAKSDQTLVPVSRKRRSFHNTTGECQLEGSTAWCQCNIFKENATEYKLGSIDETKLGSISFLSDDWTLVEGIDVNSTGSGLLPEESVDWLKGIKWKGAKRVIPSPDTQAVDARLQQECLSMVLSGASPESKLGADGEVLTRLRILTMYCFAIKSGCELANLVPFDKNTFFESTDPRIERAYTLVRPTKKETTRRRRDVVCNDEFGIFVCTDEDSSAKCEERVTCMYIYKEETCYGTDWVKDCFYEDYCISSELMEAKPDDMSAAMYKKFYMSIVQDNNV